MRTTTNQRLLATLLTVLMILFSGQSLAEEAQIHLSERLTGQTETLTLDADISSVTPGTILPTYRTVRDAPGKAAWLQMFFESSDAPVNCHDEQAMFYSLDDLSVSFRFEVNDRYLLFRKTKKELTIDRHSAKEMEQAEGLLLTPHEAIAIADAWVERLGEILHWDDYSFSRCLAMPAGDPAFADDPANFITSGLYLVEYERMLADIPIARDVLGDSDVDGDMLEIFIDDTGILRVQGPRRAYEADGEATVNVSLDQAVNILRDHMEDVIGHLNEKEDGYTITEIGLCWRPTPMTGFFGAQDDGLAMQARPAWRFASGVCRRQTNVFVMYIDAETGEVLP